MTSGPFSDFLGQGARASLDAELNRKARAAEASREIAARAEETDKTIKAALDQLERKAEIDRLARLDSFGFQEATREDLQAFEAGQAKAGREFEQSQVAEGRQAAIENREDQQSFQQQQTEDQRQAAQAARQDEMAFAEREREDTQSFSLERDLQQAKQRVAELQQTANLEKELASVRGEEARLTDEQRQAHEARLQSENMAFERKQRELERKREDDRAAEQIKVKKAELDIVKQTMLNTRTKEREKAQLENKKRRAALRQQELDAQINRLRELKPEQRDQVITSVATNVGNAQQATRDLRSAMGNALDTVLVPGMADTVVDNLTGTLPFSRAFNLEDFGKKIASRVAAELVLPLETQFGEQASDVERALTDIISLSYKALPGSKDNESHAEDAAQALNTAVNSLMTATGSPQLAHALLKEISARGESIKRSALAKAELEEDDLVNAFRIRSGEPQSKGSRDLEAAIMGAGLERVGALSRNVEFTSMDDVFTMFEAHLEDDPAAAMNTLAKLEATGLFEKRQIADMQNSLRRYIETEQDLLEVLGQSKTERNRLADLLTQGADVELDIGEAEVQAQVEALGELYDDLLSNLQGFDDSGGDTGDDPDTIDTMGGDLPSRAILEFLRSRGIDPESREGRRVIAERRRSQG